METNRVAVKWSQMEQRAIKLLGSNTPVTAVAQACGVDHSRISQLMSNDDFAAEVNTLKFQNLQKHNDLDNKYDEMEKTVADMLSENIELLMRPGDQLRALSMLNNMKRRGVGSVDQGSTQGTVVTLLMPTMLVQKFTTNINNQVINAGNQTLETIQGSSLLAAAKAKQGLHNESIGYTSTSEIGTPNIPKTISAADL